MFHELTTTVLDFIQTHQHFSALLIFILAFGESMAIISLLFPAMAILFGCGMLIGGGYLDFFPIWIAASIGAILGDSLSYWLGFHYHQQIKTSWPMNKHPNLYTKGEIFFLKYGILSIFLGRFFGPLRAVVPLIAGTVQMPRLKFNIANMTSAPVWAFIILMPGMFGVHWIEVLIG